MTEETKITAEVKVKNPKRVEAGKKLAALSKAARERKMNQSKINETTLSVASRYTAIGALGLLVAVGSLWFTYKSYSKKPPSEAKLTVKEEPPKIKTVKCCMESL